MIGFTLFEYNFRHISIGGDEGAIFETQSRRVVEGFSVVCLHANVDVGMSIARIASD